MTHLSGTLAGRGLQPRPKRFDAAAIFEAYEKPCGRGNKPPSGCDGESVMTHLSGTLAGRGLQPRPERFDAAAIFEAYEKPCGRGNKPRPAVDVNKEEAV